MPEIEVRSLVLTHANLRVSRTGKNPRIVGYAARFNSLSENLGGFKEKIDAKAFDKALSRCDVRGLVNHDANLLMGRTTSGTMKLETDGDGLQYEIEPPDSDLAKHYIAAIDRGDMSGSSFSFTVDDDGDEWDDDNEEGIPIRTVRSVRDLFDVGPVTFPAYLDTTVASRSLSRRVDPQKIYRQRLALLRISHPYLKGSTHV